jgi:hypothetical protein
VRGKGFSGEYQKFSRANEPALGANESDSKACEAASYYTEQLFHINKAITNYYWSASEANVLYIFDKVKFFVS